MGVKWHRQPCGDLALPTLGADVANAAFGEAKVGGWVHVGRQTGRRRTYKVHVPDFWICGLEGIFAEP